MDLQLDFAYAEDVADGVILTLIKGTGDQEFLNLGSGKGYSIKQLVESLRKFKNLIMNLILPKILVFQGE